MIITKPQTWSLLMAKQNQSDDIFSSDPFLDEIAGAKPTRQSEYFVPGHYLVPVPYNHLKLTHNYPFETCTSMWFFE